MITLIVVGFLAGVITSISPCILPVLPVVLTAGDQRRSIAVVAGLVLSFSVSVLVGSVVLSALHLPQDLLRNAGIAVLVVVGLGLIWPRFAELLERPFARVPGRPVSPVGSGLVAGLGLGLLFVPCAGPVLAAIAVVGATHRIGLQALVLTASFGIGVGVPLLLFALAGERVAQRTGVLRRHARSYRAAGGVAMIAVAIAVALNLTSGLQTHVPGYTTALQKTAEQNNAATDRLRQLTGNGAGGIVSGGGQSGATTAMTNLGPPCTEGGTVLENCRPAPQFAGITGWLNTDGDQPLSLPALRGKVVLVDFWTYSCINCQRSLPHLEAWYRSYASDGLVIVGVHTPEFAFEHVTSNVKSEAASLGVRYPIAIDNNYQTWNAFENEYWPADYLIDPAGVVRHVVYGEGDYATTETLIRQLLATETPHPSLPTPTDIPDSTPMDVLTPETYLGWHYAPLSVTGAQPAAGVERTYAFPQTLENNTFALSGNWNSGPEALTAAQGAMLELSFDASHVFLVLGGEGRVTVNVDGRPPIVIQVSGVPRLYTLVGDTTAMRSVLKLAVDAGVQAYDFTFG